MRVGRLVVASLQLGVCAGASDDVTSVDLSRQKGTAGPARRPGSAGACLGWRSSCVRGSGGLAR